MSSNKSFLRLLVVLAVTTEVIKAFPGVGFPGAGFSKPPNKNDILSVLMERELCSAESLAKMSSICRIICQTVCGLLKVGKTRSLSPPASPFPFGVSYNPVSYNPVPIYQSPLYYPKQQWGKDKHDWADWAKEKEDEDSSEEEEKTK